MSGAIIDLKRWTEHVERMAKDCPGFWDRHRLRAMLRLYGDSGYQFGYEIEGYGTVVGHCGTHKPHRTAGEAIECGHRFLAGEPPRLIDRMPWHRTRKGR